MSIWNVIFLKNINILIKMLIFLCCFAIIVNHTVIDHLIVIGQWGHIIL